MSSIKRTSREIIKKDLDKEFIAFINFLNESIKEFYLSTENNCREIAYINRNNIVNNKQNAPDNPV